jgi:CRP-like cAMP-binding protein
MTMSIASHLAPMVRKLSQRTALEPAEVEAILALPHRRATANPRAYLVRDGDKVESCIVLLSGFAYRSKKTGDGGRQILSVHVQGDVVDAQNSLLSEADHNVQALSHVDLAYIPHQSILELAAAWPAVARAMWRDTLVDGSISREWILNVGRRDALQRISHLLCELAFRQSAAGVCAGPHYQWSMTQEHIADATGMTPVHANRTIRILRAQGMISINKDRLTILDLPKLRHAGDFRREYLHQPARIAA